MALSWRERLPHPDTRTVSIAAAAVLAVLVVGVGAWYWYAAAESRAASAYAAALTRAGSVLTRNNPAPEARANAIKDLEAALAAYPSASLASQAALELGSLRYADRQYGPARAAYQIAAGRSGSGTLRALGRVGVAATWEAERNFGNAIEAYQAALGDLKPKEFLFEDTLVDLARVQELSGKKDEAIATYRRLLKEVPQTRRLEDVRTRMASLGATP